MLPPQIGCLAQESPLENCDAGLVFALEEEEHGWYVVCGITSTREEDKLQTNHVDGA